MTTHCPTETPTQWRRVHTPAGDILLARDAAGHITTTFDIQELPCPNGQENRRLLPDVARWLSTMLSGHAGPPPTDLPDGPPFHRACWEACRRIKPGHTRTYAQLATMAGRPAAARAAGTAMRTNPQPLLTPCHRIVSSTGLGGFSGSTDRMGRWLHLKTHLLALESAACIS